MLLVKKNSNSTENHKEMFLIPVSFSHFIKYSSMNVDEHTCEIYNWIMITIFFYAYFSFHILTILFDFINLYYLNCFMLSFIPFLFSLL